MEKRLPGIYANKIEKKLTNNEKVFYSQQAEKENEDSNSHKYDVKNVIQKINSIFESPRFVYKAKVKIKLVTGSMTTTVVSRNHMYLIVQVQYI